jgi:hypothetical protein
LGEPLRTKKARNAGFFWLASGYARFASLIPARCALGTARKRAAATIPLAGKARK